MGRAYNGKGKLVLGKWEEAEAGIGKEWVLR